MDEKSANELIFVADVMLYENFQPLGCGMCQQSIRFICAKFPENLFIKFEYQKYSKSLYVMFRDNYTMNIKYVIFFLS